VKSKVRQEPSPGVKYPRLRANFSWVAVGHAVYVLAQVGVAAVLVKSGGPGLLGEYELALAVITPVIVFSNMGLKTVQITDSVGRFRFADFLRVRFVTSGAAVIAILAVSPLLPSEMSLRTLGLLALAKAVEALSDICHGSFERRERMMLVARSQALRGAMALPAVAAALYLTGTLDAAILSMAMVWSLVLLAHDLPQTRRMVSPSSIARSESSPRTGGRVRELLRLSFPLGAAVTIGALTQSVLRLLIEHYLGRVALGVYAGLSYFFIASSRIVASVAQASSPRLARFFQSDRVAFLRLLSRLLMVAAGVGVVGLGGVWLVGDLLIRVFLTADYLAHFNVLLWLMLMAAISHLLWFVVIGLNAAHRFAWQVPLRLGGLIAILGFGILLIPRHGLVGAAWTLGAGLAVQLGMASWGLARAMMSELPRG
jgi:O-antigen/teichoic acid export membrane protein